MESKHHILSAIRQHKLDGRELPNLGQDWITYDNLPEQFATMLESVGGQCVFANDPADINVQLTQIPAYTEATRICSLIDGVGDSNVDLNAIDDPHECDDIDFAIFAGQFGVAENAAIWVTDQNLKHRVLYFIAQHIALVVPTARIVDNMHQAYEQLSFAEPGFGTFISGPSKTADIEQSLVIGAHGARSLTVFLLPSAT